MQKVTQILGGEAGTKAAAYPLGTVHFSGGFNDCREKWHPKKRSKTGWLNLRPFFTKSIKNMLVSFFKSQKMMVLINEWCLKPTIKKMKSTHPQGTSKKFFFQPNLRFFGPNKPPGEPPSAPPQELPQKPRRVVSMERIRALAEPKRKKPWKVAAVCSTPLGNQFRFQKNGRCLKIFEGFFVSCYWYEIYIF